MQSHRHPTRGRPGRLHQLRTRRWAPGLRHVAAAATLALLGACGGGGDDSGAAAPDTAPTPGGLTLTGTAATGAALANAPIEARCQGGTVQGTTGVDGSFRLTLPGGASLPCALKATAATGSHYSVAPGTGTAATTVHVTPLTTLAVAVLAGGEAAGYFDGFDAAKAAALTAAAAQQAVATVKATLAAAGIDLGSIDPLAGPLVPAVNGAGGNAHDQALEALGAGLQAGGITLAELASAVVAASPVAAAGPAGLPALPAELLLKPGAVSCAALRSGRYRAIDLENHQEGGGYPTLLIDIDAATLRAQELGRSETITLVPVAGSPCRFTSGDGVGAEPDAEAVVSGAGVVTVRYLTENFNGVWRASVLIPQQTRHTLADLAGDWNGFGYQRAAANEPHRLASTTVSVDAAGQWSNQVQCVALRCRDVEASVRFVADGSGGFFLERTGGERRRAWPYRAGGGALMLAVQDSQGGTEFYTRRQARTLPEVGALAEGWQFDIVPSAGGLASFTVPQAGSPYRSTVVSVDGAQKMYVRHNVVGFTGGVTQPETIQLDDPLPGFLYRLPASGVPRSDGSAGNVGEWINLPLRGMGLNVLGIVGNDQMVLATSAAR